MRATVSRFEIPARDAQCLARFYREAFGWTVEPLAWEGAPYFTIRGSRRESPVGGEGIHGGLTADPAHAPHPLLVVHVEGATLEECLARVEAAGGSVDLPPAAVGDMGRFARFRDPEGNLLGLWQSARAATT